VRGGELKREKGLRIMVGTGVGRKAIVSPRRFWSGRKKAGRREKKEFATKVK
jgi:hypothetical protein